MFDLADAIAFVNNQADFHRSQAEKHARDVRRAERHSETADKFDNLAAFLESHPDALAKNQTPRLWLGWDEVQDLPPELIAELTISEADKTEYQITSIIDKHGGVISLDRLLVALYRETGEIFKRQSVINRLYKMATKGLVFSVPGKKGVYSTAPVEADASSDSDTSADLSE